MASPAAPSTAATPSTAAAPPGVAAAASSEMAAHGCTEEDRRSQSEAVDASDNGGDAANTACPVGNRADQVETLYCEASIDNISMEEVQGPGHCCMLHFVLKQAHIIHQLTKQSYFFCCFLLTRAKCVFYFEVTTDKSSKRTKSFKKGGGEDYEETVETTEKQTTVRKIKRYKSTHGHEGSHDGNASGSDRRGDRGGNGGDAGIPLTSPGYCPQTPPFSLISVAAPFTPGGLYFHGPVREHSPVNHWVYRYG